jgi:addiction module RelE/StbE family toxin
MEINYTRDFLKNYKRRISPNPKLVSQFKERLKIFEANPSHPLLKDHQLTGNKNSYRAFSITGDIGVVYKIFGDQILLYDIGSHNQVY